MTVFTPPAASLPRRDLLRFATGGVGAVAAAWLLGRDRPASAAVAPEAADGGTHFPPKAKRIIHITAVGGMSQVDSFDHKPELTKRHGQSLGGEKPDVFFGKVGLLRQSDWAFSRRGQSGLWISDLFPHVAQQADELCVIRSMFAETSNHTPATFQLNSGFRLNGFPTLGAWMSYGLGAEGDDLPAFVVIPDARQLPPGGSINWTNGFLPARHQGVVMRANGTPIDDLHPARPVSADVERDSRALLARMNQRHLSQRGGTDDLLAARLRSYELAARMQLAVPDVAGLESEPLATRELYGVDRKETADFGRACLLSRRLLQRGVRFVQLFSGGALGNPRINWDAHEDCRQLHGQEALRIDRPIAALLADLRRCGMLDDTLVLFTTEFGRTPFTQADANKVGAGRDHNQYGFTCWMAGAGVNAGSAYGSSDEIGWKAADQRVGWHDFHATVLHLMGIDHKRLTFYHNGIQRRITDVSGEIVKGVLA